MSQATTPPRLLRKREVLAATSMSASTLQRRINEGNFPRPVEISPCRVAWRADEITAWIDSRVRKEPYQPSARQ
jgi:prophage regulatory protein